MCFPRRGALFPGAFLLLSLGGCGAEAPAAENPGEAWVSESIQAHGGDAFQEVEVTFRFRGADFRVRREGGAFLYERRYSDDEGHSIREVMENEGTWMEVDGQRFDPDPDEQNRVEVAVNSVVYFAFLPFRLDDPAVHHRELGTAEVAGEPYRKVEVTFQEEGGGEDWEDRFVYWFHADSGMLDYLAYTYERGGGGSRFRRAVNRREVGGIVIQDYENYRAASEITDIAEYDRYLAEGEVELVSMVELEDVQVRPLP